MFLLLILVADVHGLYSPVDTESVMQISKFHHAISSVNVEPARSLPDLIERFDSIPGRVKEFHTRHARGPVPPKPDDFFEFIPIFLGALKDGGDVQSWPMPDYACFHQASASVELTGEDAYTLSIDLQGRHNLTCNDLYLFAAVDTFHIHQFDLGGKHTLEFKKLSKENLEDLKANGLRAFHFKEETLATLLEFWETLRMFLGGLVPIGPPAVPKDTAEKNLAFLRDHMDIDMPPRDIKVVELNESYVKSGDFLGIIRLDGLDPMIAWGMGSHTGHTTTALWIDDELYVTESQTKSHYWPTNHIQKTPYRQWLKQAQEASYNVVHLPLSPESQKRFNHTAAVEFFKSVEGVPYGMNNFLFGWIDTPEDNYPHPLSSELVMVGFALLQRIDAALTDLMWNEALNFRLGTKNLTAPEVYAEARRRGLSFGELMSLPELDKWKYPNQGPSYVCDVYVCEVYKHAGLFGDITDTIQCTEFTNFDVYSLDLFDAAYVRPPQCVEADPDSQFCQLLGDYRMALPGYNTVKPYPHMRQNCGGLAPNYYWSNSTC